jgi:hypothetical protein
VKSVKCEEPPAILWAAGTAALAGRARCCLAAKGRAGLPRSFGDYTLALIPGRGKAKADRRLPRPARALQPIGALRLYCIQFNPVMGGVKAREA